jgi:hypothetical protein
MTTKALQTRDKDGLTLAQRRLLGELALTTNWRQACTNAGVPPNTLRSLLSTNKAFQAAYNNLLGPAVEVARDMLESSVIKVAGMYDEAVEAVKMVELEIVCPECKHEFPVANPHPDWATRLRAGDTVLRVAKLLKDVKEISGTITHLTLEESLALARWKHDGQISPSMIERLRQKGLLNETNSPTVVDDRIDGLRPIDGDSGSTVPER